MDAAQQQERLDELRRRIEVYNEERAGRGSGFFGRGPPEEPVVWHGIDNDGRLMAMLRTKKFNVEKTLRKVVAYSRFVEQHKDWTLSPDVELVRKCFGGPDGCFEMLQADRIGRQIWFQRTRKQLDLIEQGISAMDQIKTGFWVNQGIHTMQDVSQSGVVVLQDMADTTMGEMMEGFPQDLNKTSLEMMEVLPIRLKRVDLVHQPWWIGIIFALIRPFMTGKMRGRIHMHGKSYNTLKKECGEEALPVHLGGKYEINSSRTQEQALQLVSVGYPQLKPQIDQILCS